MRLGKVWGRQEGCCAGEGGGSVFSVPPGRRDSLAQRKLRSPWAEVCAACCLGQKGGALGYRLLHPLIDIRMRHREQSDSAVCPPIPKPGLLGNPANPSQATDQGAGLVSALGPAPPPLAGSLPQSGLAISRAQPTETLLCTPHRSTWKMNGSGVLRGPTSGQHSIGGEGPEQGRAPSQVQVWRGTGPDSLCSLGVLRPLGSRAWTLSTSGTCAFPLAPMPHCFPETPGGLLVWERPILCG